MLYLQCPEILVDIGPSCAGYVFLDLQKLARQEMLVSVSVKGPRRLLTVLLDRQYHSKRTPSQETRTWRGMTGGPAFRPIARPAVPRNVNSSGKLGLIRFAVVC
jgi:hypothetical protein